MKAARRANKWLALGITALGTLVSTLNAGSINVANPLLAETFDVSMSEVQWLTTAYMIVVSSLMLLFGRLGNRLGAHRIYNGGLFVFALGTLLCATAGELFLWLLAGRIVQACGASMLLSMGMGLVTTIFPDEQRGTALGINVLVLSIGSLAGPTLGGLVLSFAPWPMIFWSILPVCLITGALACLWLRSPIVPQKDAAPLDLPGCALLAAVIAAFILFLNAAAEYRPAAVIAFACCLIAFVLVERRHPAPIIDMGLLRNTRFAWGNLIAFFSYSAGMLMSFQMPFFLQDCWGIPVAASGLIIAASPVAMAVFGPISGFLSDKFGAMRLMPLALGLLSLAFISLLFTGEAPLPAHVAVSLACVGSGMGMLNSPNNSEIMSAAGRENANYAGGFVALNRNVAFSVGTGISSGVFPLVYSLLASEPGDTAAYVGAFHTVAATSATLALVALALCLVLRRKQKKDLG